MKKIEATDVYLNAMEDMKHARDMLVQPLETIHHYEINEVEDMTICSMINQIGSIMGQLRVLIRSGEDKKNAGTTS